MEEHWQETYTKTPWTIHFSWRTKKWKWTLIKEKWEYKKIPPKAKGKVIGIDEWQERNPRK